MTVAVRAFRDAGTNVETPRPVITPVTDGIYARSWNPMYLALALLFAGIGLLADSGWLGLLLMPFLVVLRVGVVAREERYLERRSASAIAPTGRVSGDGSERRGRRVIQ